jgi:hypothetical protein
MLGVAVTVGLVGIFPEAQATDLSPGGNVIPDTISSLPAGSVLAYHKTSLSAVPSSTFAVTLASAVWQEAATGHLDFLYQVISKTPPGGAAINDANFTGFAGVKTNVSNLSPTAASGTGELAEYGFVTTGTVLANLAKRNSGLGNDNVVDFQGSSFVVPSGQASFILTVSTNATGYQTAGVAIVTGGSSGAFGSTFAPVAPVPEPASLVLLGGCFAGLGAGASWRRWRKRATNSGI